MANPVLEDLKKWNNDVNVFENVKARQALDEISLGKLMKKSDVGQLLKKNNY